MFKVSFKKIAGWLLPPFLRGVIITPWVKMLVSPVDYVNGLLVAFVARIKAELAYNGQTIMLERMLNDYFPGASPLIYITLVGNTYPVGFEFDIAEGQPQSGFEFDIAEHQEQPGFEYDCAEYNNRIDFIIHVPASLSFDSHKMTALTRKYCKFGKNFIIQIY